MYAVVLAGGQGTRLRSVSGELPKPMVRVCGRPVLEHQIGNLRACGLTDIIIMTGYKGEVIREYFGDGSAFGVSISYVHEQYPLGTAGALWYLRSIISDDFVLIGGDLITGVDYTRFIRAHREGGGIATLFVHPNSHPYDSDLIITESSGGVGDFGEDRCGAGVPDQVFFAEKSIAVPVTGTIGKNDPRPFSYANIVNSGLYCFSAEILEYVGEPASYEEYSKAVSAAMESGCTEIQLKELKKSFRTDLDRDIIRPLIAGGKVFAYSSTEYVRDMGTPERLAGAEKDIDSGLVAARNYSNKQKCIFLDRDGTVNRQRGFISDPEEIELEKNAAEAIKLINSSGYLAVVLTNQPVIARGEADFDTVVNVNRRLETLLGEQGAYLDGIYFCPHHPDSGFEGEVRKLKFACRCRKPGTGMPEKAALHFNAELSESYIVGDTTSDIECGRRSGMRTVLVHTGFAGKDGKYSVSADIEADDLLEAVRKILSE